MSVGSVIRYSMTLDGGQYISELRQTIAATKAAEKTIADEAKAMGVITVSAKEAKEIIAKTGGETKSFAESMSGAMLATKGFNAAQSAFAQAMNGNFVGALRSGSVAVKSLWTVMLANPLTIVLSAVSLLAAGFKLLVDWHDSARDAARKHAKAVDELRDSLNEVVSGSALENTVQNIERMKNAGDMGALQNGLDGVKESFDGLNKVAADLIVARNKIKIGGFGLEKEQKAVDDINDRLQETLSRMSDNKRAAELYRDAISGIREETAAAAATEQVASAKAIANYDEKIAAAKEEGAAIAFANLAKIDDMDATIKQLYRERELYGARDEMEKLLIRRKHLMEDLSQYSDTEVDTERIKEQARLELEKWKTEQDILKVKEDAKNVTGKEGTARKKAADDLKGVEETVTDEKRVQLTLAEKTAARMAALLAGNLGGGLAGGQNTDPDKDLGTRAAARAKAFAEGMLDEWKEFLPGGKYNPKPDGGAKTGPKGGKDGKGNDADPNAPDGGAGRGATDPWSAKLDAIKTSIDSMRSDLTGGGE